MLLQTLAGVITAAAVLSGTPLQDTRAHPTGRREILALAHDGRAVDAWKAWEELPQNAERLRIGVSLSAATYQLSRGIDLYDALSKQTGQSDRRALTELALAVAEQTGSSDDFAARIDGCAAALVLDKTHAVCQGVLHQASLSRDVDEQAHGVYALANAGLRQSPAVMSSLALGMSKPTRLQLARRMTRLTGAERLGLLQPLLNDADVSTQYETVLTAIDIPGPEVADALTRLEGGPLAPPVKIAVTLARARHGDKSSLAAVGELLPSLNGFERILAATVLASAKDKRGIDALNDLLKSRVDVERLQAALALADVNPKAARPVLIETIRGGSPAIRQSALLSAGPLELGTDPAVYRRLTDGTPAIRAAAVEAIASTFWHQDHRAGPPQAQ